MPDIAHYPGEKTGSDELSMTGKHIRETKSKYQYYDIVSFVVIVTNNSKIICTLK